MSDSLRQKPKCAAFRPSIEADTAASTGREAEQLVVRAALAQLAVVKDHDAVAFLYRRQPVSDDHRCSPFHDTLDRLLDKLFGLGVDRARRFIENQVFSGQTPAPVRTR